MKQHNFLGGLLASYLSFKNAKSELDILWDILIQNWETYSRVSTRSLDFSQSISEMVWDLVPDTVSAVEIPHPLSLFSVFLAQTKFIIAVEKFGSASEQDHEI